MQATYNAQLNSGSLSVGSGASLIEADTNNPFEVTVPPALLGQLTTRTDNNTGVVTAAGHEITTADIVDLYTTAGIRIRDNMTVTNVTGDAITVDGGDGNNLPALNDAIVIAKRLIISPVLFSASGIQIFGVELKVPGATSMGMIAFFDDSDVNVGGTALVANEGLIKNVANGDENMISDDAAKISVSNGNTTLSAVLVIISMEDRTPE